MTNMDLTKLTAEQAKEQYPGSSDFVHLHAHTLFSILDGVAQPDDYFKSCAERKWPAMAITEHGVLNSIPDAYFASKAHKVKLIVGNEFYYNDYDQVRKYLATKGTKISGLRESDLEFAQRLTRNRHLTVLAKNMTGYENILKINKLAWKDGYYYKPRIWFDLLAQHKEGLIVLSGCLNGPVSHEVRHGNISGSKKELHGETFHLCGAIEYAQKFYDVFGDDYYIELQMPGIPEDERAFKMLAAIAENMGIKPVLTNDSHYMSRRDFELQKIMMAIDQDTTVDDPNLFHVNSSEQYLKTRYELRATFMNKYTASASTAFFERACDTTLEIADKCQPFKPNMDPKLPNIEDADDKLIRLTWAGLKERNLHLNTERYLVDGREVTYKEQILLELQRFIEKKFSSYFLITRELIKCSVDNGYPIGPARGSAGGSLVCYLIGIHALDPIKWGLSFDRFLSPSRGGNMLSIMMPRKEKKDG